MAQAPMPKASLAKADLSQEALVIERVLHQEKFEADGTAVEENTVRVRIQSDAGLQRYGLLSFSYPSATGTFEIAYVRVHKPDGSVVETPPENVQDMAAQITRQAPSYSDLHEKHVAVKGLSVGDVLEFHTKEHTTKPLVPGQFWTEYRFTRESIVLDEQMEVRVPRGRAVKIKSTTAQPVVNEAGGYRTYTWHSSNLQRKDEKDEKREATGRLWQQLRGLLPQPDVLVSSFASWEEVGRWYGGLQEERVKPAPDVTAKALELTRNASSDEEKLRALYSYVSTQFRYIGVSFGIGRYQPHGATEVLANQYGDCKDKHTLLASLLTAVGIPAYPALVSTSRELDSEVPSLGQVDHVITVVPRGSGLVWLDTTTEVGPYQYLVSPLRDKHALVIWKDRPPALVKIPADLPFQTSQRFNMDAKLDDAGTLVGHAEASMRGDFEFVLRSNFRAVPLPQWKALAQQISFGGGFGGEVSEVTASSPEKTDEPFHFAYQYTRKEFGDWANRRILAPSPALALLASSDEEALPMGPLWLGSLTDTQFHSQTELPGGYRPNLPDAVHLKQDFAQYDSTYEFKDGKLISDRHLQTLLREVPAGEREAYKQFMKTLQDDYSEFIPLSSTSGSEVGTNSVGPGTRPAVNPFEVLGHLPDSPNAEATRLEKEASQDRDKGDAQGGVSSLYRAVAEDPKFTRAWVKLGSLLLGQKHVEAGLDAFQKAMVSDPTQPAIPKALGFGLMAASRCDLAIPVWQNLVKAHPDDVDGPANLGSCLAGLKRYPEAIAAYEAAAELQPKRADWQAKLGSAYLQAGDGEKAGAAFRKFADLDPNAFSLNNAAYALADAKLQLPLALDLAKKAVRGVEEESQKITLPNLKVEDLPNIYSLAAYWDTLGWVHAQTSNLEAAELYLRAAWKLTQDGVIASHLCQVYERMHKMSAAIQMCRLAAYRLPQTNGIQLDLYTAEMQELQKRIRRLTGEQATLNAAASTADVVSRERNFKLARFLTGTESAEFFVLLASDGKSKAFKVLDTKFIKGSEKMKLQGKQLTSIDFNFPAPSETPARFVRRGILGCYQYSGCSFLLLDPASSVRSLD
jgi:tetratricopeptide (TPR) repeat protein/transglutaminase-like putative cysteine protease